MFTGLIDAIGTLDRVTASSAGRELRIQAPYEGIAAGESIAVNGACLTVRAAGPGWFDVAAVVTTRDRTTIGSWTEGRRVNLERSLKVGDRMGGHIVQGHVDGVGLVSRVERCGDTLLIELDVPASIFELLVPHGAITVDGISLTVNEIPRPGVLQLSIIEYTERHTAVSDLAVGSEVHLEGDVVGKYVRQLLHPYRPAK
jgi:riboflavin synthase